MTQFKRKCSLAELSLKLLSLIMLTMLASGCSLFTDEGASSVSANHHDMDEQYLELKTLIEQQKIEWQAQRPALERLVKNEEDLVFLIDALSKLAVVDNSPSTSQYLYGKPGAELPPTEGAISRSNPVTDKEQTTAPLSRGKGSNYVHGNPLASLANSDQELNTLMIELQKLARTIRYKASVKKQTRLQVKSMTPGYGNSGMFANSKKQLVDYAEQLAGKLARFSALEGARVGVTSFVNFDQNLNTTSALGNQLAEALMSELPQYGVNVIDFKLTRNIDVSAAGDLAMSRDMRELAENTPMEYILTGTLVTTRRGVRVNSRIVSTSDNSVLSSASTLLPNDILQQIQP